MDPLGIVERVIDNCLTVLPGQRKQLDNIQFEVVPAYNMPGAFGKFLVHKKVENLAGYIIAFAGFRVYHAGDTDFIPEMKEISEIDIAILPIGVGNTAMTPQAAAEAVASIRPKIVVPVHYDLSDPALDDFKSSLKVDVEIQTME